MFKIKKSFKLLSLILSAKFLLASLIPSTHALGHNMDISKFVKIPEEYILCHGSIFPVEKRIVKNVVRGILEYCVQAYENSIYRMNFSKDDITSLNFIMESRAIGLKFIIDNYKHATTNIEDISTRYEAIVNKNMIKKLSAYYRVHPHFKYDPEKISKFLNPYDNLFRYISIEIIRWLNYDTDFSNEILKYFKRIINATREEPTSELHFMDCLDI